MVYLLVFGGDNYESQLTSVMVAFFFFGVSSLEFVFFFLGIVKKCAFFVLLQQRLFLPST